MNKPYSIGLDIGTSTVGYSVTRDDLQLVRKRMKVLGDSDVKSIKKNFWGVNKFDGAETAQATRVKRTTRRRYTRRKFRIHELQVIFENEINKIDSNFFQRLSNSFYVPEEKGSSRHPIFGSVEEEVKYHEDNRTIFHLRQKLADDDEKYDIRLVYLAVAHIIKYRGHFLINGKLNTDNSSIKGTFSTFLNEYNKIFEENFVVELNEVKKILESKLSKSAKVERIINLFDGEKKNGGLAQFIKIMIGNKANFKIAFEDIDEDLKLKTTDPSFEEDLEEVLSVVGDEYADVLISAKNVYDSIELSKIIKSDSTNTKAKLSSQMIEYYNNHCKDLKKFKEFLKENLSYEDYKKYFNDNSLDGYAGYIDGKTTPPKFYSYTEKLIENIPNSEYYIDKINQETFLRKQRSIYNGVIPHQIHLEELKAIIENQGRFYPFLLEYRNKIESLLTFRIPYYVGPLQLNNNSKYGWMIRKKDDAIKPWNFDEIVDRDGSAKEFMNKLISSDTYLLTEKVLPKRSLVYQKYAVFNELTKVSYIDDRGNENNFSGEEKLNIYNELFKKKNNVTEKDLKNYLRNVHHVESPKVKGIDKKFNSNLSTYMDLNKINGMEKYLEDDVQTKMLEDIVKILTVFEDKNMRKKQLSKYKDELGSNIIKELARKHYQGWGRLSNKLINGIRDENTGKTILDFLIEDDGMPKNRNRNFIQLINDDTLSFKRKIEEEQTFDNHTDYETIVSEIPGSPAIKKGILQSLKIVDEIINIMGYEPEHIVIEMARENQTTQRGNRQSRQRLIKIKEGLSELGSTLLTKNPVTDNNLLTNRLYLYYLQNGKDMYTGEDLSPNPEELSRYDIDHVIPRSFTTDNSLDNLVLVKQEKNRGKLDDVPAEEVVEKMEGFWRKLLSAGLMTERKFNNLTKSKRGGLTENDKAHFIKRQLVETRQITKHVANILDSVFNTKETINTKVVLLNSNLITEFRNQFDIHKTRLVNDYHHAHDAYIATVIANKLLKVYPNLESELVYGMYSKKSEHSKNKATAKKQFMSNIMKFFKEEEPRISIEGEIVWDANRDIGTVKKVLSSKQINIVKKAEEQTSIIKNNVKIGMFKATPLPAKESNTLIPLKKNLPTNLYGGYIEPTNAYSLAITYEKGKNNKRSGEIIGIKIHEKKDFENQPIDFLIAKGYKNPIIKAKLLKNHMFEIEDGTRRYIASANELHKANQLYLNQKYYSLLYHAKRYNLVKYPESYEFINKNLELFDDLFDIVINFAEKYIKDANKKIEKIVDLYNNHDASAKEITESIINLMDLVLPGTVSKFNFLGVNTPRKQLPLSNKDIWNSTLIYHSVTGLYETRIKLEV